MIKKFDNSTALIIVDAQKGVNDTNYYGGSKGKRNNPNAEKNIISVLKNGGIQIEKLLLQNIILERKTLP